MVAQGLAYLVGTDEDIANLETNVAKYLETKNELLLEHLFGGVIKLINSVKKKYYLMDSNDFYSDANLAMFDALRGYDRSKGSTFATHYMSVFLKLLAKRIRASHALMRAKDHELLYLNAPIGSENEDMSLGDIIPSNVDLFEKVLASYIPNDVKSSKRFSKLEKDLFHCQYIEDFTLQDLVDNKYYASKQTACRASLRLNKKLKLMYGGC